jgi:hypothetical protein
MALPNENFDKVKVYANEYINHITINRGSGRLLENDLYLYNLISFVNVPFNTNSPGNLGEKAIDNNYIYFHNGTQWGRIPLDTSF